MDVARREKRHHKRPREFGSLPDISLADYPFGIIVTTVGKVGTPRGLTRCATHQMMLSAYPHSVASVTRDRHTTAFLRPHFPRTSAKPIVFSLLNPEPDTRDPDGSMLDAWKQRVSL